MPSSSLDVPAVSRIAFNSFSECNYPDSKQKLQQLHQEARDDPRLKHNAFILQHYANGLATNDKLLTQLGKLYEQIQIGKKGTAAVRKKSKKDDRKRDDEDDELKYTPQFVETALIQYNRAVLLFGMRRYGQAAAILEDMLEFIEPMHDFLGCKILILLMELYLAMREPVNALAVLQFAERPNVFATIFQNGSSSSKPAKRKIVRKSSLASWRKIWKIFRVII